MRIAILLLIAFAATWARADPNACEPASLRILLTNDDGYDTPGITALHSALVGSGHQVKRVAPDENYSGSSASVNFDLVRAPRVPIGEFTEIYAVSASPATTVLLGATALFTPQAPAQLVISGINEGANLGPATTISGTVGATIAAIRLLAPPLPAIAVSTNMPSENSQAAENHAHVANVAAFVSRLVKQLQCAPTDWFSERMALNVNYPPLAPPQVKGVRVAEQGTAPYFKIGFESTGGDRFAPSFGAVPNVDDPPRADTMLFNNGYITVVPIDGNYTASGATLPVSLELIAP